MIKDIKVKLDLSEYISKLEVSMCKLKQLQSILEEIENDEMLNRLGIKIEMRRNSHLFIVYGVNDEYIKLI